MVREGLTEILPFENTPVGEEGVSKEYNSEREHLRQREQVEGPETEECLVCLVKRRKPVGLEQTSQEERRRRESN